MKDEKRAREFIKRFGKAHPKSFFKDMDDNSRGMHAVLHMLDNAEAQVVAGDIASELGMSTPRVAATLKTLESKGYIERAASERDARKTVVRITDGGRAAVAEAENGLAEFIDYLMESVGERDMNEFLRISGAIARAVDERLSGNEKTEEA